MIFVPPRIRGGLSPLARGTQGAICQNKILHRFIPAGAGNTKQNQAARDEITVYPRWRGEHGIGGSAGGTSTGLSPLARGTLYLFCRRNQDARFIPAGAGNTFPLISTSFNRSVYPRWRGEHDYGLVAIDARLGLSPLARGTQNLYLCDEQIQRFIPAGAGNTSSRASSGVAVSVYPRWRGEHAPFCPGRLATTGLSPLARGTPPVLRIAFPRSRFIPAGAGNTDGDDSITSEPTVYPRWRGEHTKTIYLF